MTQANTATRYGSVAKAFHWSIALLVITLIPLGIVANGLPFDTSEELAQKALLFSLHKTLGVFVFFLAVARIAWALTQIKPAGLHPERKLETLAAELVHWLLYGSLLLVPLSGWIHHAATTGFAPIWWPFGQNLPFVPKSESVAGLFAGLHIVFERVLAASILLHVAGALKHHFIDRDATLRRMWFGQTEAGTPGARHAVLRPLGLALIVWAAAISLGSVLGLYHHGPAQPQATTALESVESDWTVQDGTLAIGVTQLGSLVEGSFDDWTAKISFDETIEDEKQGEVEVTIAIASLKLGSVTSQAMGPDYFDSAQFPTAVFKADLLQANDGYTATGALTLRGKTIPVTMPFDLNLDGDTANVTGTLTLDRRDFGIGDNMADEGSLKFAVDVDVTLSATRAAP